MKKKKNYLLFMFLMLFVFIGDVFAYGYSINITSKTVTVGNSVTLNIKSDGLAGKFDIVSSNTSVATLSKGSVWGENDTQSITIKTNKVGSSSITITPTNVTTMDDNPTDVKLDSKTIVITVKEKPKPSPGHGSGNGSSGYKPAKKSSNNFLTSITIDNIELNEEFDKETLEYSANIPADTEKIKINAQLDDSSAQITGTGEVDVSVGLNTFELVVTAENGSKRTYILKANVLEAKPINVLIDNKEYKVIRKRKELPKISEYFTEKDILIDNEKVEGYYNETLDYTIVGLKDYNGKIEFYIYKDNKYQKYQEHSFNGMVVQILDKEVANTKKTTFMYDGDKINSYQEVKLDYLKNTYAIDNNDIIGNQFYLFYAKNLETGKEELYQYDAVDKTIQRYNSKVIDLYRDRSDRYYVLLLVSLLLLGITFILFVIFLFNKNKHKNKSIINKKTKIDVMEDKKKKIRTGKDIEKELEKTLSSDSDFSFSDLPLKKSSDKLKNKTDM